MSTGLTNQAQTTILISRAHMSCSLKITSYSDLMTFTSNQQSADIMRFIPRK